MTKSKDHQAWPELKFNPRPPEASDGFDELIEQSAVGSPQDYVIRIQPIRAKVLFGKTGDQQAALIVRVCYANGPGDNVIILSPPAGVDYDGLLSYFQNIFNERLTDKVVELGHEAIATSVSKSREARKQLRDDLRRYEKKALSSRLHVVQGREAILAPLTQQQIRTLNESYRSLITECHWNQVCKQYEADPQGDWRTKALGRRADTPKQLLELVPRRKANKLQPNQLALYHAAVLTGLSILNPKTGKRLSASTFKNLLTRKPKADLKIVKS